MNIHFIGCEGVSMKVLRRIVESMGHVATGSDITLCGHSAHNVNNADIAVYTTAVGEDNCEVLRARELGIPLYERAAFLGMVERFYRTAIAVSGSHGKTTATGFCASVFSGKNPTVHIGGTVDGEAGRVGGKEYFICEACEYKRAFLHLNPTLAVILNIELDHTDYYKDFKDYLSAFREFAGNSQKILVNADDKACATIEHANKITFGLGKNADFRAEDIERTDGGFRFTLFEYGKPLGKLEYNVLGFHNVYNALAAASAARIFGLKFGEIWAGIEKFGGAARRFELLAKNGKCAVYSDYAHHPSELDASVKTARSLGNGKVTYVFQPHTYTRLKSLMDGFAESLSKADRVVLLPVYAAREKPIDGVSSRDLAAAINSSGTQAVYAETFLKAEKYLAETAINGETIVFAGAGDIDKAARDFARLIKDT